MASKALPESPLPVIPKPPMTLTLLPSLLVVV